MCAIWVTVSLGVLYLRQSKWQPHVESEGYFITYFNHIAVLYRYTPAKGWAHAYIVDGYKYLVHMYLKSV